MKLHLAPRARALLGVPTLAPSPRSQSTATCVASSRRAAVVLVTLLLLGVASAQTCARDDGSGGRGAPQAWGAATCVEGVATEDRHDRSYQVRIPSGDRRYTLRATTSGTETLDLCLVTAAGDHCRRGDGGAELPDLVLPAEDVVVRFTGRLPVGGTYRIVLEEVSTVREGFEREPNDGVASATPLGPDLAVRGRLEGREQDYFRVEVTGEPQLWRVQVVGAEVTTLRYHDAAGRVQQDRRADPGDRGIRLSNLHLLPGTHFFSVDGTDADYALRLLPLGPAEAPPTSAGSDAPATPTAAEVHGPAMTPAPPPPGADMEIAVPTGPRPEGIMEREPNDDGSRAHRIRPNEPWVGLLAERGDRDVYRFYLGEEAYLRLSVTPPPDGAIDADVRRGFSTPGIGVPYVYQGWFLAGDHVVTLRPQGLSEGYYQILLEVLDPFDLPDDLEPNDVVHEARPLPADFEVRGTVGTHGDYDRFLTPTFAVETAVTIELEGDGVRLDALRDLEGRSLVTATLDRESGIASATLEPGGPYVVSVSGSGSYRLGLSFDPGPPPMPRAAPPAVGIDLVVDVGEVAAFHHLGQRLALRVDLRNEGAEGVTLDLESHVSDHGWIVELDDTRVTLAAGESRSVGARVTVMPIARDDLSVHVSVGARSVDGGVVSAVIELAAVCGVPAVDPAQIWPLPEPLLGGLNVAWMAFGSEPLTDVRRELLLYDGLTPPGDGFNTERGESTTVRLAGADAPRVLGVLLHPLGAGPVDGKLADFRVSTSIDGRVFTPAHEGRMRSIASEQAFVFAAGVPARFVRLELLSRQDGDPSGVVYLGQFKVIAEPTSRPLGERVDIARRAVGGYVTRADPHVHLYALTDEPGNRPISTRLEPGQEEATFVLGFHHDRAALVDSLEWVTHPESDAERRMGAVEVAVSTGDALGPFTSLGTWRPHEQPTWRFDDPTWARFVRFTASGFEPRATIEYPAAVRVFEHPAGPEYRSILGEWGHYARDAALEWRQPPSPRADVAAEPHASRATARVLTSGDDAVGRVLVGEYEAWYRIDVPTTDNHLRLELAGDPVIAYAYELVDEAGDPVDADTTIAAERITIEAYVEPGRYYLRAWEPQRSVIFAWDNSGSMGPYIEATYQTVVGFARDVSSDREQVQLLAFEDRPAFIMERWTGDPTTLLAELTTYDRSASSSAAEPNFAFAIEQLADREGTKAILFVTDAESGASPDATLELWRGLDEVRPRVFTFETSTAGSDDTQDRMQSWAVGGFYDYSRTIGDLEVGFARVSCLLRQPKTVAVALRSASVAPPGPGSLSVRRLPEGAPDDGGAPALVVIFDASGSMGKLLPDGSASRLLVAREVLTELVETVIEPGTPFALRAYGHVLPTSCDTRLELPLGPLDRAVARTAIASIDAKLLSGTPLAASIAMVADDLALASGPKTVILITDGEESCGGDPEAEIRALKERGIDVQLSIIAFDLDAADSAAAAARFSAWAELGGGRAFDATSRDGLRGVLLEALVREVGYEVLDVDGAVIARGVLDGEAISVPTGAYRVRVDATPEILVEEVRIRPDTATSVVLEPAVPQGR
ncbi:MAG: VWA domain-containing protein [Trueperaceae bacterium]|nr:VWA domain-containing protein [Trueperaceae bacterium]